MTDPGLNNRLRQRSRRAGLMVGVTMALTIVICVGGFAAIYAGLVPFLSDVVPAERTRAQPPATRIVAQDTRQQQPTVTPQPIAPAPEVAGPTAGTEPEPEPTATEEVFQPTHQVQAQEFVNLRPEPSRERPAIVSLAPGTPLQYLDEDAPTQDPNDAPRWMKFRTEDGQEGWIREIDTVTYRP